MKYLTPVPKQFVDFSGIPYSGGSVTVYVHGTTDKAQIYAEADSNVLLNNPCQLDSNGAWKCFVPADIPLDYIVQDRDGNVVASYMNIVMPLIDTAVTKGYVDSQDQLRDRNFALNYDPTQAYPLLGTYVMNGGRLYKSAVVIDEPEEWNADHWTECTVTDELDAKIAAETSRATEAEASARTEVVQGENCSIEKTTAADGHDVYTVNADGKPQIPADWEQADSSKVDYIKNKPNLGLKADKVQGATAGNLAALDASGNLANSGKKAADFKTKQTAITDPTADGTGLSFIDSVSQNANGEITPHKKTVQDGSTVQKGVVQLQDSVGPTESVTDKAVTPHAVRAAIDAAVSSAYHAAGTKTVAQLTGSLLIAANEGDVYNITDSGTTDRNFIEGAGHPINAGDNVVVCDVGGGVYKFDLLSGFVDLSNYLTKTGNASNTTSTFTKASGDTSTITSGGKLSAIFTAISSFFASLKALAFKDKASYSDLSSGVQSSLDKADSALQSHQSVTDNNPTLAWGATSKVGKVGSTDLRVTMPSNPAQNLPASVITSGTFGTSFIADDAITAEKLAPAVQTLLGKANTFNYESIGGSAVNLNDKLVTNECHAYVWTYANKNNVANKPTNDGGVVLSFGFYTTAYGVQIAMDGNDYEKPLYVRFKAANQWGNWIPFRDASWINSGTFGTDRIADDAITAAKVKDNETLPVEITGGSRYVRPFIIDKGAQTTNVWAKVATASVSAWNGYSITFHFGFSGYSNGISYAAEISVGYQVGNGGAYGTHQLYVYRRNYSSTTAIDAKLVRNGNTLELWVKDGIADTSSYLVPVYLKGFSVNYADSNDRSKQLTDSAFTTYIADKTKYDATVRTTAFIPGFSQVGSTSTPVYVDANGQVVACNPSLMTVGNATKWDGHAISVGTVVSNAGTISIA